jgi:hypothetical protein
LFASSTGQHCQFHGPASPASPVPPASIASSTGQHRQFHQPASPSPVPQCIVSAADLWQVESIATAQHADEFIGDGVDSQGSFAWEIPDEVPHPVKVIMADMIARGKVPGLNDIVILQGQWLRGELGGA